MTSYHSLSPFILLGECLLPGWRVYGRAFLVRAVCWLLAGAEFESEGVRRAMPGRRSSRAKVKDRHADTRIIVAYRHPLG